MALVISDGDYAYDNDVAAIDTTVFGNGAVLQGGSVTVSGTNSLVLAVGTGTWVANGSVFFKPTITYLAVTAAASQARIDLVTMNTTGSPVYTAGTAAADPSPPNTPANTALVAFVNVGSNAATISTADIQDKRLLGRGFWRGVAGTQASGTWISSGTNFSDFLTVIVPSNTTRMLDVQGYVESSGGDASPNYDTRYLLLGGNAATNTHTPTNPLTLIWSKHAQPQDGGAKASITGQFTSPQNGANNLTVTNLSVGGDGANIWGGSLVVQIRYKVAGSNYFSGMLLAQESIIDMGT